MAQKLWGGRFKTAPDPLFERFSSSIYWDVALRDFDLKIDQVQVDYLSKIGVLSAKEKTKLKAALAMLLQKPSLIELSQAEDVHSAIQMTLKKIVGELADKIHTGRSRNDLVSQSSRLFSMALCRTVSQQITQLQLAFLQQAQTHQNLLLPGMTHLQNAQVLSLSHIFLAYIEMLERGKMHFSHAYAMADACVLGSGALAGVPYALDQKGMAKSLDLSRVAQNSYDVAGDREYVLTLLFAFASLGVSLSRIAEDFMLAQTKGFGWLDIDEAFCTGSSIMPQKKNADFVELLRGSCGVFSANMNGFLVTLKGLPTSYNRDLQWDKKFMMDSGANMREILAIFVKVAQTLRVRTEKLEALLCDESLYATDLADYLVAKGLPFAKAHQRVGQIVRFAEENNVEISKIGLDLLQKFDPKIEADVYELFSAKHSVEMKKTTGSTHPKEIKKQITEWKKRLKARKHASV